MNTTFCTIITADYIHYALALNESLLRFNPDTKLDILISDKKVDLTKVEQKFPNLNFHFFDELCKKGLGKKIYNKYFMTDMDCFRWSMKPVFIKWLIAKGHGQVFFLDCDLYFFNPSDFLQEELQSYSILLTPHWRSSNPQADENNFKILQTSGLYNGGFIGVSDTAVPAMEWWASACLYKCAKQPEKGLFVDQAYLDLLPVYFEGVKILRHKGCNVAKWNQLECKRTHTGDHVLINEKWEIVFIHFTGSTVRGIQSGEDGLLKHHLELQQASLEKFRHWIPTTPEIIRSNKKLPKKISSKFNICSKPREEEIQTDDFLNPILSADKLDIFFVRSCILRALNMQLGNFQGKLLDVGCGQMPYKPLLTSSKTSVTKYIGLDFKENPIHDNKPDITWEDGQISLGDNTIDCAIATEVFEHCPTPEEVLHEVNRVLKPGGFLFFTVPFLWPLHEVPYDQYRYTPIALKRHLANSGFVKIELNAMGGWDASLAQMLGLWVRRRPLGRKKRAILSYILLPIIKKLAKRDHPPKKFSEQTMITGISGTCIKPS